MKRFLYLAVVCLLASASTLNAQLIIRNSGHAEIGHDPYDPVPEGLNPSYMIYKHNHIPYIAPMLLQNAILTNSQYVIASDVVAGNSVDVNRTPGDVIVSEGVEYEIEASRKVILEHGFKVEKGALFSVYPSCF